MSDNNQPLSGNTITPLQRVSLNSALTNLVLDSDSGNSSLIVRTGSIPSFYIDKFSNVGINTTTPGAQFEVASNNGSCVRLRYGASTTSFTNIFMSSSGNLSINPNASGSEISTTASLNIVNHNGASIGLKLNGTLVSATAAQLNYTAVAAGSAAPSKALVLDSSSSISGIGSISATNLTGTLQTAAQPNITSVGSLSSLTVSGNLTVSGSFNLTGGGNIGDSIAFLSGVVAGTASASKALVLNSSKSISGIESLGLTTITIGGSTLSSTESGYLTSITAGTASPSKALVLNGSGSISGINGLTATNLTGTLQTASQPNITSVGALTSLTIGSNIIGTTEASYIVGVVAGTASNSKVLVLNSSGSVSGINSLSATDLTGTLQTAAQTRITSVGTLTSLTISGATSITSTTDATGSSSGGALTVSGGLAVAKNAFVGGNLTVTGSLFVNGTTTAVNSTSISIQDNTLILNATPLGPVDSGIIVNRYQTSNDTSTGSVITDTPTFTTTSSASTTTTITLTTGSSVDNYYQGWWIKSGNQVRQVQSYVGSTKVITLSSALTTTITNGASVSLYNKTLSSVVWNESNKQFLAAYTAMDSTSTLAIIDRADFGAANITSSGRITVLDTTDASSTSNGSLVIGGGVGIAKNLYVGSGIYGTLQTGAQPNITSVGTLSSLTVTNGVSAATLTGAIQTAAQTNITSVGTLTGLAISSTNANALTITNASSSGVSNLKLIGDSYSCEFGVRGTSAPANPSTLYIHYNNAYRLLMDVNGNVSIGTESFGYKLNVSGSLNATSLNVGGVALATSLISGSITAGTAAAGKVLSVDSSLNVSNINSLTASQLTGTLQTAAQPNITSVGALTSLTIGSALISGTDASYLNGITAGTAAASKALILGSSREISNVGAISSIIINDSSTPSAIQTWTNDLTADVITKLGLSNVSCVFGTSSNHKLQFMTNNTYVMHLQANGNVSIGADVDTYKLSVGGSFNATSYYLNGSLVELSSVVYTSGITTGTAAPSKALVLDASSNISGINSISTSSITIGGAALTSSQATYLTGITTGTAAASKALILDASKNISGINSLTAATLIVNGLDVYTSIASSEYLNGITAGTASASKALVLDTNKSITGITSLGSTTLVLGSNSLGSTEAGYLTSITAGTASVSKALVLNSSGAISGISSLSTTTLVLGSNSLGSTEAGYLTSITAGIASASKALVLDSNKSISGIGAVGLSGLNDLLSLTNNTASGYVAQSFVSDTNTLVVGVRGSTNATNPNTAYWQFGGAYRMLMNASGQVSIATATFGYALNVGGSFNATSYLLNGSALDFSGLSYVAGVTQGTATNSKALVLSSSGSISGITSLSTTTLVLGSNSLGSTEAGYLTSITAGTAANGKALVLNSSGAISGITSLSATTLILGSNSLGSTEAGYLTSITVGTASASKAVVLDSSKGISGLGVVSLTGASDILNLTNTTASAYVAQTFNSDSMTFSVGVRGSTNATNPNTAYLHYAGGYRLLINSSGEISLGTNTFGYRLNVNGSTNSTGYSLNGTALDFSGLSYITGITAGTAANNKALVLNASGAISGITSLSTTTIVINGSSISAEAAYIAGVTAGTAANSKALVLNASGAISGISSLSTTTLVLGSASLGATEGGYLTSITAGTAAASKAVVLDSSKNISGINAITTSTLTLGSTSLTTTEAAYLTAITAGTASASKAVVLDSSKNITGISSIGLTLDGSPLTLTNTATTARTTIKFVNDTKTYEFGTAGSGNTTYPTGALYLFDSTSSAIRFMVGSTGNVAIGSTTANDRLNVNGAINATGYKINNTSVDLTLITGITAGTASASKAVILDASTSIAGLTSVGTTTLVLGSTSIGSTEAAYLTSITTGTASASKALVLNSSSRITSGLRGLTLGGVATTMTSGADFRTINNAATTFTNGYTAASGTESTHISNNYITAPTMIATNTGVTTTTASTMFITGAPAASTNMTITNSYGLYAAGTTYFDGNVGVGVAAPAYKLDVNGSLNATSLYAGGAAVNLSAIVGVTAGTAAASKALIVDASKNITGIGTINAIDVNISTTANASLNIKSSNSASETNISFEPNGNKWLLGSTGSTHSIPNIFYIYSSTAAAYRLAIDSDGDVGIGFSSPSFKLDVNGQIRSVVSSSAVNDAIIATNGTVTSTIQLTSAFAYLGTTSNHNVALQTGNTNRMTIDTSGNVGIGTSTPSSNLEIYSSSTCSLTLRAANTTRSTTLYQSATADYCFLEGKNAIFFLGSLGGSSTAGLGHGGALLIYSGNTTTYKTSFRTGSDLYNVFFEVQVNNAACSVGTFSNHNIGIMTNNSNRMIIDTTGGIKRTGGSTSTSFDSGSDRRIKEDIVDADINLCYDNIKRLKLKYYKWSDEYIELNSQQDTHVLGWIAQEVEEIFPKSVTKSSAYGFDDFRSLNVDTINRSLYGCVSKLIQDKEALEEQNVALEAKVDDLEARLARLEALLNNQ